MLKTQQQKTVFTSARVVCVSYTANDGFRLCQSALPSVEKRIAPSARRRFSNLLSGSRRTFLASYDTDQPSALQRRSNVDSKCFAASGGNTDRMTYGNLPATTASGPSHGKRSSDSIRVREPSPLDRTSCTLVQVYFHMCFKSFEEPWGPPHWMTLHAR